MLIEVRLDEVSPPRQTAQRHGHIFLLSPFLVFFHSLILFHPLLLLLHVYMNQCNHPSDEISHVLCIGT